MVVASCWPFGCREVQIGMLESMCPIRHPATFATGAHILPSHCLPAYRTVDSEVVLRLHSQASWLLFQPVQTMSSSVVSHPPQHLEWYEQNRLMLGIRIPTDSVNPHFHHPEKSRLHCYRIADA